MVPDFLLVSPTFTSVKRELLVAYNEHKAKGVSGIILDAQNGGIKAMSCMPSFNLNEVPRDNIKELQEKYSSID